LLSDRVALTREKDENRRHRIAENEREKFD